MKHAKIIADSITQRGHRLTTLEVIIPNIVVPEMLKHRMFSISSMSMRAVPFEKMVKWVEENPFIPYAWQKSHKGMQGTEYWEPNSIDAKLLTENYLEGFRQALRIAKNMYGIGCSKQICNRLLFPFGYTKMIITATEWENFFKQRLSDSAEIHMKAVAQGIWDAMQESEPILLREGEWHIPYLEKINSSYAKEISIAKCARQSFDTEWSDDYSKDLKLFERLKKEEHWVPFEHVAQVMDSQEYLSYIKGKLQVMNNEDEESNDSIIYSDAFSYGWADNFRGFMSVRFQIKNGLME